MGSDAKIWIRDLLMKAGFDKIECIGEFRPIGEGGALRRHLFMAEKSKGAVVQGGPST